MAGIVSNRNGSLSFVKWPTCKMKLMGEERVDGEGERSP